MSDHKHIPLILGHTTVSDNDFGFGLTWIIMRVVCEKESCNYETYLAGEYVEY